MESVEDEFEKYLNLTDEFKVKNEKVTRYGEVKKETFND
jgi:hypothetical protein